MWAPSASATEVALMSRVCSVITCPTSSAVRPPLVRRRDGGALVLHRDAAKGVVLPLRVTWPVIWHKDPRQPRVTIELDAEHVPGLALVPVIARVYLDDRGDVAVVVRAGDLQTNSPATVRDREQVIDGVQLSAGLLRVVDTRDAAHLEAQQRVVTQCAGHAHKMVAGNEDRHLAAVDHHCLDGL